MKEFEIINKYFKKLTLSNPAADGLNNDVANFSIENDRQLVVSKDVMVEDVHFKRIYGGSKVAHKLLTSNLSDLASAGASPHSYMIGFTKDDDLDEVFLSSFCSKLSELSKKHNISLIGGDTTSSNAGLFFSLTIFGTCPKNKILSRSGGCDEDLIFVSGNIGDSYVGLTILQNKIDGWQNKLNSIQTWSVSYKEMLEMFIIIAKHQFANAPTAKKLKHEYLQKLEIKLLQIGKEY